MLVASSHPAGGGPLYVPSRQFDYHYSLYPGNMSNMGHLSTEVVNMYMWMSKHGFVKVETFALGKFELKELLELISRVQGLTPSLTNLHSNLIFLFIWNINFFFASEKC